MGPEALAARTEARQGSPDGTAEIEKPKTTVGEDNLDDATTQDKIFNPPPGTVVQTTWGEVKLYPLVAKYTREWHGVATEIIATASQMQNNGNPLIGTMMLQASIAQSERLTEKVLAYTAYALDKPGAVTDQQARIYKNEMNEKSSASDLLALFTGLSDVTGYANTLMKQTPKEKAPAA